MYTLYNIRGAIRKAAKNAMDSTEYWDVDIDRAWRLAANKWIRLVRPTRQLNTLTLTAGSPTVPALPAGCLPEQALQVFLTLANQLINPRLIFTSYEQVLDAQYRAFPSTPVANPPLSPQQPIQGQPLYLGYVDQANAIVYPTPDQPYVIQLWWWALLTAFTAGAQGAWSSVPTYNPGDVVSDAGELYACVTPSANNAPPNAAYWVDLGAGTALSPTAVTFNIPDDHIDVIAELGASYFLQHTEAAMGYAADAYKAFLEEAKLFAGRNAGGRGGNISVRGSPRSNSSRDSGCGPWFPVG